MRNTKICSGLAPAIGLIVLSISVSMAVSIPEAQAAGGRKTAVEETSKAPVQKKEVPRSERWRLFREHLEGLGKSDLLPEEEPDAKTPASDAILGILFRISPDIAAAHDFLTREPADVESARKRLQNLGETKDPYIADYAKLLKARCDLLEKNYKESLRSFEEILYSSRNLAVVEARKGIAESLRGLGETSLELLELRFLLAELPVEGTADRTWAEERVAEIRRDHSGPLHDSGERMDDISTRLAKADPPKKLVGDQEKVEVILEKIAKLLEEICPKCGRKLCDCPG